MRNFKKAVVATLSFVLLLSFASGIIIYEYIKIAQTTGSRYSEYRNNSADTFDFLMIGSSSTRRGFIPKIVDDRLYVNSYNMSESLVSPMGKLALFEDENERSTIKTVVLEVNNEDLRYNKMTAQDEGEIYLLPRIRNAKTRYKYFLTNAHIKYYANFFGVYIKRGIVTFLDLAKGGILGECYSEKGYMTNSANILFLKDDDIVNSYRTQYENLEKNENYEKIAEIIKTCQSRNIEVILVTVPVAEMIIWQRYSYDRMNEIISNLADEYGCEYFDFNLIKNRNKVLNDRDSFADYGHLSSTGAEAFTNCFCDVMKKLQNGEDVSDMFYDSYEEAITHFEYYKAYQKLIMDK